MSVPQIILDLVERFERNREAYRAGQYNETQVRREFIDPFFKALGWDIDNEQGNAEAYKDVIHEDAIKIGSATKAPDYCFRIGGARKFFLEAKKPSIDIKGDPGPAYQLRRYAWSAKLPLSILTDFEELAVYDCRVRPVLGDKSSTARVKYYTYTDYIEKWDEIASVFSKDAVLKGSFDKYAEKSRLKKGTAQVDDAFLMEIESWRDELAHNIALRNSKLDNRQLNFAVQMTIDRLIFLRICEDRGVERYGELMGLMNGDSIYQRLLVLFRKADDRYNSGLFHFSKEKDRPESPDELTPNLAIDDKVLKSIFKRLYYPDSPYEFSVLPAEILGQVYEQFLGKVITLTSGHHAKVEDKPEVKKAGGVFYTPAYIVDYIVQNTVGKLVDGKTPKEVEKIKILDPACGSGSFLLGAYQFLLDWHLKWYLDNEPGKWAKVKKPPVCSVAQAFVLEVKEVSPEAISDSKTKQGRFAYFKLTLDERKKILLNNIFGVDIDTQAVEVTKLSLLLKVLEGEKDLSLFARERALPDLGQNIKCGNSLIGPDFYHNQQGLMFDDEEQKYKINAFDWQAEFEEIFSRKNGGFDAVIGNPPYIRIQTMKDTQPESVEYFSRTYKSAAKGNYDIYVVFVEKALQILNPSGKMGFILPHKFFNSQYGQPLRKVIADGKHLSHIVHFGDQQVFKDATTYTCLLFLDKSSNKTLNIAKVTNIFDWQISKESSSGKIETSSIDDSDWIFFFGEGSSLYNRLLSFPIKLKDIAEKIFQGLVTSADAIYFLEQLDLPKKGIIPVKSVVNEKTYFLEESAVKPLCKGSLDVRRYNINPSKRVIFPYDVELSVQTGKTVLISEEKFLKIAPATWQYLLENEKALRGREKGKMNNDGWYGYVYPKSISFFAQKKILTPSIASNASFSLDSQGDFYFVGSGGGGGGGYGIILNDHIHVSYEYILGLLNSKLLDWFIKKISSPFRGGYFAFNQQYIRELPIYIADISNKKEKSLHGKMVSLVEGMLDLHKKRVAAKTPNEKTVLQRQIDGADDQIDRLVYELYGLTEEEIKIVEGAGKR